MNRLLISAAHKSSGKTMISIGLAAAFARQGQSVAAFKKGPDYIDPIWLQAATGRPCWNLDFFTMSHEEISDCFRRQALGASIALIEGNKGLHDGLDVEGSDSSAALAKLLNCPVVLVLDVTGITRGIVPLIEGYQAFDPQVNLVGVILNRVGEVRHEEKLRAAIGHYCNLPILGSIGRSDALHIKERHLGLVPGNEREDADTRVQQLADQFDFISNPRSIGTVAAFDVELPGERALFKLSQQGFDHHLTIRPLGNTIYLYLPLVTNNNECDDILNHLKSLFINTNHHNPTP